MIPEITTDPIDLAVSAGVPVTINHGLGRQIAGWIIIWKDGPIDLYIQDSSADTSQELVLVPTYTGNVRVVLL